MQVAFISSALAPEGESERDSFDFFALLLNGIVTHAQADTQVVVFVPTKTGPKASDQPALVRKVLGVGSDFHAIVIAPFQTKSVKEEIQRHFGTEPVPDSFQCKALVFIDKNVDPAELSANIRDRLIIKNVCCDNEEGGREAANILWDAFEIEGIPNDERRFMILQGLEGGEDRAKGFEAAIEEHLPGIRIEKPTSNNLNFTRRKARLWMQDQIEARRYDRSAFTSTRAGPVSWGIFACNDEMALGVRSVVAKRYDELRTLLDNSISKLRIDRAEVDRYLEELIFLQRLRIVGFDGIAAALEILEARDPDNGDWLVGTIKAQVEQQSRTAMEWLDLLINNPDRAASEPASIKLSIEAVRLRK